MTSQPCNGKSFVQTQTKVWTSQWSVILRTFYRQILSLLYGSFFFWNFRHRLARELLGLWGFFLKLQSYISCTPQYDGKFHPNTSIRSRFFGTMLGYIMHHEAKLPSKTKTTWLVVANIFYFHPYLGKWSNLTHIFQMGWNHKLENQDNLFHPSPISWRLWSNWPWRSGNWVFLNEFFSGKKQKHTTRRFFRPKTASRFILEVRGMILKLIIFHTV